MRIQKIFSDKSGNERLYSVLMSEGEFKLFSNMGDLYYNLSNLDYCKEYPKFVVDYIKNVQSILKGGDALCSWCFPVAPIDGKPKTHYFQNFIQDGLDLPLVFKDGGWYEEKGIFFKKLNPVQDPAKWLYDYIISEVDLDDPENKKNSDYQKFTKALNSLKRMIGKYKS